MTEQHIDGVAVEQAWRDGFQCARDCLTEDEAFCLTEDVEEDVWRDSKTRLAASPAVREDVEARERVAMIVMAWLHDNANGDWPRDKVRATLDAVTEDHSGDCTKQPWTCIRCVADEAYAETDQILAALTAKPSQDEAMRVALDKACYVSSERHLSGARLTVGFNSMEDAGDAHQAIATRSALSRKASPMSDDAARARDDHGTANEAIEWVLHVNRDGQEREFMAGWQQGDLDEWPEFYEWLDARPSAAAPAQRPPLDAGTIEACAKVADSFNGHTNDPWDDAAERIADDIRALAHPKGESE